MFRRSFNSLDRPRSTLREEAGWNTDGGVHQLFTIVGRSDVFPAGQANTCTVAVLPPTDFETQCRQGNLRFRHHQASRLEGAEQIDRDLCRRFWTFCDRFESEATGVLRPGHDGSKAGMASWKACSTAPIVKPW